MTKQDMFLIAVSMACFVLAAAQEFAVDLKKWRVSSKRAQAPVAR